jgi:hypothetical protein
MGGSQEHTQPHSDKRACGTKISAQGERQQTVHDAIHASSGEGETVMAVPRMVGEVGASSELLALSLARPTVHLA